MNTIIGKRIALFLVSASLVACGGVEPPASSQIATRTSALTTVTISGTVTDVSGVMLIGVKMTLSGSAQASTTTNFAGQYTFTVNPGSYTVTPSGVCTTFEPSLANLNNVTSNATADFVASGGPFCSPQTFSGGLSGSLTISGTVTSAGHPVPGARVTLNGGTQGFRVSDQAGAYSFSVNPGSYSVSAAGGCNSFAPPVANLNNIRSNQVQSFVGSGNCPIAPLALCPTLDVAFLGANEPASCNIVSTPDCAFDRADSWGFAFLVDFLNILGPDCRFGKWFTGSGALTNDQIVQYVNDLDVFFLYFFGCPATGTQTGPLSFSLIPAAFAGRTFTTADVAALSADFEAAIAQAFSDAGAPPLTGDQNAAIANQLNFLAGRVPGLVTSNNFTSSTCP
jgi:hypothetical protein